MRQSLLLYLSVEQDELMLSQCSYDLEIGEVFKWGTVLSLKAKHIRVLQPCLNPPRLVNWRRDGITRTQEMKPINSFSFHNGGAPEFAQENVVHSSLQFESAQQNNRVKPETTEILPILKDTRKSHEILSGRIPLFCGILYGLNPVETGQHLKIL